MLNRLRWLTARLNFKVILFSIIGIGLYYLLYIWRLGSLTPGLSPVEAAAAADSTTIDQIVDNPLYAPHKIVQFGLQSVLGISPLSLRLASAIFIVIFIVYFYLLVIKWFGKLIGLTATVLLASLPWTIIIARDAPPSVLLLAPIAVFGSYYWLARTSKRITLAWLLLSVVVGLSLYIPGMLWIILVASLVGRKLIWFNLKRINKFVLTLSILLFLLVGAPLAYGIWYNPDLLKQIALIPNDWHSLLDFVKNTGWSLAAFFLRAREHFQYLIGTIPILSVLISVMVLFGVYAMNVSARQKLLLMASLAAFSIVTAGLNDSLIYLTLALPALVVIAAAGLRFLFLEWQSIFPRNPIPKNFAYLLILSLALIHIIYGASYGLAAWPNTPETRSVYMIK